MEKLEKENYIPNEEIEMDLIDWCIENIDVSKGCHVWDYPETSAFGCECNDDEDLDNQPYIGEIYVNKSDFEKLTVSYCNSCEAWSITKG